MLSSKIQSHLSPIMQCATCSSGTLNEHGAQNVVLYMGGEGRATNPPTNVKLTQTKMTVDFSKDVLLGMLRKGQTGTQLLNILNVIVPDETPEMTREYVCDQLGIADCPENDDEIAAYLAAV